MSTSSSPVPPPLPPVPPTNGASTPVKDATWWRQGKGLPYFVAALVLIGSDFLCPLFSCLYIGFGTALGSLFFMAALMLLRRDLTRAEMIFLGTFALISAAGQAVSGSVLCWFGLFLVPMILLRLPQETEEPQEKGRSWWAFWLAKRPRGEQAKRLCSGCLPTLVSGGAALALFFFFLAIFASGNPVVEQARQLLVQFWHQVAELLHLDWDVWAHAFIWCVGLLFFGFYTAARQRVKPLPHIVSRNADAAPLLPQLPSYALGGINAAFAVATSTDMLFLWFRRIPEGISQTQYLLNGADSIIVAAILAAAILLILFRRTGIARSSRTARIFGYLLVLQTALLAVSVFLRLYYQVETYGFTYRRVLAAECMLCGLVGIGLLLAYMCDGGCFLKYLRRGFCLIVLFFFSFNIQPPSALAADLNQAFGDNHPEWHVHDSDFVLGYFDMQNSYVFALEHMDTSQSSSALRLHKKARLITERNTHSWRTRTFNSIRFADAAADFLTAHP